MAVLWRSVWVRPARRLVWNASERVRHILMLLFRKMKLLLPASGLRRIWQRRCMVISDLSVALLSEKCTRSPKIPGYQEHFCRKTAPDHLKTAPDPQKQLRAFWKCQFRKASPNARSLLRLSPTAFRILKDIPLAVIMKRL